MQFCRASDRKLLVHLVESEIAIRQYYQLTRFVVSKLPNSVIIIKAVNILFTETHKCKQIANKRLNNDSNLYIAIQELYFIESQQGRLGKFRKLLACNASITFMLSPTMVQREI